MFAQYLLALHQTQFAMCNVTVGDQTAGLGQDQPNNTLLNPMAYLICTLISLFVRPEADLQILMLYVRQSVSLPCLPLPDLCSAKFFFATISTSPDFYFVYFYKSDISLHIYHKTIPWLTHYWLPHLIACLPRATAQCDTCCDTPPFKHSDLFLIFNISIFQYQAIPWWHSEIFPPLPGAGAIIRNYAAFWPLSLLPPPDEWRQGGEERSAVPVRALNTK